MLITNILHKQIEEVFVLGAIRAEQRDWLDQNLECYYL